MGIEGYGSNFVSLVGRVPTKISNINGHIISGDPITSSDISGVGMKATRAGQIVGKALEPFDETKASTCPDKPQYKCGEIMVFLNVSWYDSGVYLTSTGELKIVGDGNDNFDLKEKDGSTATKIGVFAEIAIAKVRAGFIDAKKVVVDGVDILKKLNELSAKVDEQQKEIKSLKTRLEEMKKN